MALTGAQKIKLVTLLGWPAKTLDNTNTSFMSVIRDRIEGIDSDIEPLALEYMEKLAEMDGQLTKAIGRAGIKSIDDIEFFGDDKGSSEFMLLRKERKRLIRELGAILDIAVGPGAEGGTNMVNISV